MDKIIQCVHKLCALLVTITTLVLIDIPLKGILIFIFLLLALIIHLICPSIKRINWPNWFSSMYYYAFSTEFIASKVWKIWHIYY